MFCTKCGKEHKQNENFCTYCGNKLNNIKKGNITIHRIGRYVGCLLDIEILIDKKKVGLLQNRKEISINIPIGTHKIIYDSVFGIQEQEITITDEYPNLYIDIQIGMGAFTNKIKILNVRKER